MEFINGLKLDKYKAKILQPISILGTEIKRQEFESANGDVFYSDKKLGLATIKFKIELKGNRSEIKTNKSKLLNDIEVCKLDLNDSRVYEGRFIESGDVEVYNNFEVIEVEGKCAVYNGTLNQQNQKNNGKIVLNLESNVITPLLISIKGNGTNISIKSKTFNIFIKELNGIIKIDGKEKTVKNETGTNVYKLVDMFEFPKTDFSNNFEINISGTGNFDTNISYYERLI